MWGRDRLKKGKNMQTLKIQKRLLGAALAASLAVGMATSGVGQVVIGDFETGTDNWDADGTGGSPTPTSIAQSTTGVTLNNYSLAVTMPTGSFWGAATGNLGGSSGNNENLNGSAAYLALVNGVQYLSYDVTLDSAYLGGATWAQGNEVTVQLYDSSIGFSAFIQENWSAAGVYDSSGQAAQWGGVDGTRQVVWNLSAFKYADPNGATDGNPNGTALVPFEQTLAFYYNTYSYTINDIRIDLTEQGSNTGPMTFFYDDVQLTNVAPEPSTIAMLLAGGAMLIGLTVRRTSRS